MGGPVGIEGGQGGKLRPFDRRLLGRVAVARRTLVVCVAAGLASAFNAPLAAVLAHSGHTVVAVVESPEPGRALFRSIKTPGTGEAMTRSLIAVIIAGLV